MLTLHLHSLSEGPQQSPHQSSPGGENTLNLHVTESIGIINSISSTESTAHMINRG